MSFVIAWVKDMDRFAASTPRSSYKRLIPVFFSLLDMVVLTAFGAAANEICLLRASAVLRLDLVVGSHDIGRH